MIKSSTMYVCFLIICVLVQQTLQRNASISTESIMGVTRASVVSLPSESVMSVQASISATSTQVPSTTIIQPRTTARLYSKPVIFERLRPVTVTEGQTLEMRCNATGYPKPYIIWEKENKNLKNTSRILGSDGSLLILNTSRHDAGEYHCIARNIAGQTGSTALVSVNYISDVNITIDKNPVQEGTDVKLTCSAHSHPRVFFSWTKNGEIVKDFMVQNTIKNGVYVVVLHRSQISREMGGNYTCFAQSYVKGLLATASKLLRVHLAEKPTYPPSKEMETTAHTIAIPIHKIKYLSNGKKVRYVQIIVQQLKDDTLPDRQPSSLNPRELGPYKGNETAPYVTAILDLEKYKGGNFILGDDVTYSIENEDRKVYRNVYRNVPLRPGNYYTAFQRMISDDNDHESLDWIQPTKTNHAETKTSSSNLGLILGITLGLLLLIGIIVAVVVRLFIVKKPRSHDASNSTDALEMYHERELFAPPERPQRPPRPLPSSFESL